MKPASDPVVDPTTAVGSIQNKVGGSYAFTTLLGTLQVARLSSGMTDSAHASPAAGYQFRSIFAQWANSSKLTADTPETPSDVRWTVARAGVTILGKTLDKPQLASAADPPKQEISATVSVHNPPVAGGTGEATIFTLYLNNNPFVQINLDTGAIVKDSTR